MEDGAICFTEFYYSMKLRRDMWTLKQFDELWTDFIFKNPSAVQRIRLAASISFMPSARRESMSNLKIA